MDIPDDEGRVRLREDFIRDIDVNPQPKGKDS